MDFSVTWSQKKFLANPLISEAQIVSKYVSAFTWEGENKFPWCAIFYTDKTVILAQALTQSSSNEMQIESAAF